MSSQEYDLKPVSRLTTGAIGPPGKRVFYMQASTPDQTLTLIVEKQQVQSLAIGLEEFLSDLHSRLPDLPDSSADFAHSEMELVEPLDPIFRVGQIGLGYDEEADLLVLVMRELLPDQSDPEEAAIARFWCTRSQLRAMCQWGLEVASQGRPICGNCGEPIDSEGHFCPKRNGHKH